MSRYRKLTIALCACVVVLIAAVGLSVSGIFNAMGMTYANAERYTAGETTLTGGIRHLDIQWVNGRVRLAYHAGDTTRLSETSDKPISADLQLRWWLDGDTLRVRYAKSGLRLSLNQTKELTLTLPEGTDLGDVRIEATSADLSIPVLQAESLSLHTTSGDIGAAAAAGTVSIGATSGDIALRLTGMAGQVTLGTTSGSIGLEAEQVDTVKASSTSGAISLTAQRAGTCDAGATSGNVYVDIAAAEQVLAHTTSGRIEAMLGDYTELAAESTSGSVTCVLPENPGFTATLETTSGRIDYSVPISREGKTYRCGDGSRTVRIGTTSGSILLSVPE